MAILGRVVYEIGPARLGGSLENENLDVAHVVITWKKTWIKERFRLMQPIYFIRYSVTSQIYLNVYALTLRVLCTWLLMCFFLSFSLWKENSDKKWLLVSELYLLLTVEIVWILHGWSFLGRSQVK